jgi:hypothetical protein
MSRPGIEAGPLEHSRKEPLELLILLLLGSSTFYSHHILLRKARKWRVSRLLLSVPEVKIFAKVAGTSKS